MMPQPPAVRPVPQSDGQAKALELGASLAYRRIGNPERDIVVAHVTLDREFEGARTFTFEPFDAQLYRLVDWLEPA